MVKMVTCMAEIQKNTFRIISVHLEFFKARPYIFISEIQQRNSTLY